MKFHDLRPGQFFRFTEYSFFEGVIFLKLKPILVSRDFCDCCDHSDEEEHELYDVVTVSYPPELNWSPAIHFYFGYDSQEVVLVEAAFVDVVLPA